MKKISILLITFFFAFSQNGFSQKDTLFMVADAHFDSQWNWTVQTSIKDYLKPTFEKNFALIDKYPDYKFNFEGAIKYMWLKEYYPDLFARLKGYVANGRWHISGASLDANDVNVPSAESNIRNILIGQTFYKKEFGVKSTDIFLPDCFGFGYTLPSIAAHCGLIGFSTQKLTWGSSIGIPYKLGIWQGVDGSKIMSAPDCGSYGYDIQSDLSQSTEFLTWTQENGKKTGHYDAIRYFGTGDTGGSPSESSVQNLEKSIAGTGALKIKCVTSDYLFKKYKPTQFGDFPLLNGEMLMTKHGVGCYTSRGMLKRLNRKNELLADAAEKSAVVADWLGGLNYPATELNDAWIKFIWHQFHDDLTGTSIIHAYDFSYNDEYISQNKFANVLQNAVGASARTLNTQTTGVPMVVYNPLSIARNEVVEASLQFDQSPKFIKVTDKSGNVIPAQILSNSNNLVTFIFPASVKSYGYEVYDIQSSETAPTANTNLKIAANSIENSTYKITINATGDVSSIIDKENGNKELLSAPIRLAMFNDLSYDWPSWEITYTTVATNPRAFVDQKTQISIEENGPVRVTLKISRERLGSKFVQYIRLNDTGTKHRIDFVNEVNWNTKSTLLKAVFPFTAGNAKATYDLGLGTIKRGNNTDKLYEVPAQQWADITNADSTYGVSILNDCKYGWDKPNNNTLRLSLIHTPGVGTSYPYEQYQDLGINKFTFSVYGHTKNCLEANTVWEASKLNQPLIAFETVKHDGDLGKSFSFVSIDSSQVALKACKKAEDGSSYVLRFYETKGKAANNVRIKFPSKIVSAKELNGIEEEIGAATFSDSTLILNMKAYQPKTFGITLSQPEARLTDPESTPVTLAYNADIVTSDANRTDGYFDNEKHSYSAELLPDSLIADGIKFKLGPKAAGQKNVIRCKGDLVKLPIDKSYTKLYILAATSNKNGSKAQFQIDGLGYDANIQYFTSYVAKVPNKEILGSDTVRTPGLYKKDNIAWTGTHRHSGLPNADDLYVCTYLYKYCIKIPAGAEELVLPTNDSIAVFAMTMANNTNDDTKPAVELIPTPEEVKVTPESSADLCGTNMARFKKATASGSTGTAEDASKAVDTSLTTKWCDNSSAEKWLEVDLADSVDVCGWKVVHAGSESADMITQDFRLQYKVGTVWKNADIVILNTDNITNRAVKPFKARNVRLYIDYAGRDGAARIYDFQVFGKLATSIPVISSTPTDASVQVYPNPNQGKLLNVKLEEFDSEKQVEVSITNLMGKVVFDKSYNSVQDLSISLKKDLTDGVYFLVVRGKQKEAKSKFIVVK